MSLPDAVLQADREADEAAAAFETEMKDTEGEASSTLDIDADDADQTDGSTGTQGDDNEGQDSEGDDSGDAAGEQGIDTGAANNTDWKQRYNTLLGKYNAEVPRLTRDLDYLRGQVEAMARANVQRLAQTEDSAPAAPGFKKFLKSDELEDYDEDILDFQSRLARGEAEAVMSPVVQALLQRIEHLEGRVQHDESDSLWNRVEKHFPGAKEINDSDPLFEDFLNQREPISGLTYKDIGEAAYISGDVGRIVSLFEAYTGKSGGGATSAPPTNGGKGQAAPPVKPSRTSGGTVRTSPKDKPIIRERDLEKFFTDVATGKYAGREEAMKKREALIESAVLEGRVRPG